MVEIVVGGGEPKIFAVQRSPDFWILFELRNVGPRYVLGDVETASTPAASHELCWVPYWLHGTRYSSESVAKTADGTGEAIPKLHGECMAYMCVALTFNCLSM